MQAFMDSGAILHEFKEYMEISMGEEDGRVRV